MKSSVIEVLSNSSVQDKQKFSSLLKLYSQSNKKDDHFHREMNRRGYNKYNLQRLIYECKKAYQITDLEIKLASKKAKTVAINEIEETELNPVGDEDISTADENLNPTNKLREDYPFLNDPGLPEEFKILAADKITAYTIVKEAREKLEQDDVEKKLSQEQRANLVSLIKSSEEENALIHKEFEHFKEKNEVLGEHSIFKERMLKKKIDKMTGAEKAQRIESLKKMIKRDQNTLKRTKDQEKIAERKSLIEEKELELQLVTQSLA